MSLVSRKVAFFLSYAVTSAIFVILNRRLLTAFPYPLTVTAVQQSIVCIVFAIAEQLHFSQNAKHGGRLRIPWCLEGLRMTLPCTGLFISMVAMNNVCLRFTTLSGYAIARATTIVFNLILAWLFLRHRSTLAECAACGLVCVAVFVGTPITRLDNEIFGTLAGLTSSASQAAFSCVVARLLRNSKESPKFLLLHYTATSSVIMIALLCLGVEKPVNIERQELVLLVISGVLNAAVAVSAVTSLQISNPIAVNLVGYAKAIIQTIVGVYLLGETCTTRKASGLAITLVGSFLYSFVRSRKY